MHIFFSPLMSLIGILRKSIYKEGVNEKGFCTVHRNRKVCLTGDGIMSDGVSGKGAGDGGRGVVYLLPAWRRRVVSFLQGHNEGGTRDYVVLFVAPVSENKKIFISPNIIKCIWEGNAGWEWGEEAVGSRHGKLEAAP